MTEGPLHGMTADRRAVAAKAMGDGASFPGAHILGVSVPWSERYGVLCPHNDIWAVFAV